MSKQIPVGRRCFHVDIIHNGSMCYYNNVRADNAPSAQEIAIEEYMKDFKVAQSDRRTISANAY
jgi:hypothetical protein